MFNIYFISERNTRGIIGIVNNKIQSFTDLHKSYSDTNCFNLKIARLNILKYKYKALINHTPYDNLTLKIKYIK